MLQSAQTVECGTRVGNTATLWSATSPSLIMNLQWNHWAAFGSLRCSGRWQRGELAGLTLQWRANSNPGTMGRPKSSRILSQVSVPTHPSNPRRAVTPLGSPGTTPIPCLPSLCPPRLLCQSVLPADFTSFPLFLYCLYISLPSREIRTADKEETKVAGDIFFFLLILSPLKILTNRFLWDAEVSESPAGDWRRIDPSLSGNPELWHVMIRNGTNSSLDKMVRLGPALLFNPLSSREPHTAVSSGLLLHIIV